MWKVQAALQHKQTHAVSGNKPEVLFRGQLPCKGEGPSLCPTPSFHPRGPCGMQEPGQSLVAALLKPQDVRITGELKVQIPGISAIPTESKGDLRFSPSASSQDMLETWRSSAKGDRGKMCFSCCYPTSMPPRA